ncbi:nitrogen regulation protein NR(II) [Parashewanella curva]|uniref:Sensory histidine kinase/phosphatase NtrB n=1 Tax=Parashewanella curva TaxID=2338552 RepID=A0A3L8PZG8_9GAMM|nr:nitrogen regulation protein NR(II) [Parashewanella curva]RLV60774.1 nitrogen regulation protein NR(II) [Parashewanella curva]
MDSTLILENLSTAVMVVDDELRLSQINTAASQLLGTRANKLQQVILSQVVESVDIDWDTLKTAVSKGQSLAINRSQFRTFDGELHTVDIMLSPLMPSDKISVLELRKVDQQRRIYQQSQQDAQQQAARFLVRNLAHEIKNPLGGLKGAAQLLHRELNGNELTEFTHMIIEQTDRMGKLVDRLLGPQRPVAHQLYNIHQVCETVLNLAQLSLPSHIEFERDYDPSLPDFAMEPEQMQQALLNVLQNAIEALGEQAGKITVKTRTRHQVTLGQVRHKLVIELSIIDNGPGVPDELQETLFYPMVTGRDQGSGLGLSIAQQIANVHKGRLDFESCPGKTEFMFLIPILFEER